MNYWRIKKERRQEIAEYAYNNGCVFVSAFAMSPGPHSDKDCENIAQLINNGLPSDEKLKALMGEAIECCTDEVVFAHNCLSHFDDEVVSAKKELTYSEYCEFSCGDVDCHAVLLLE